MPKKSSFITPVILALLALLFSAQWVHAQTLTRGPMLQQPSDTNMLIVFDLSASAAAEVHYGLSDGSMDMTASSSATGRHKIHLSDLIPGSRYQYQVMIADAPATEIFYFYTAPMPGESFNFAVLGDTRSGHDNHAAMLTDLLAHDFSFLVNSGDLVSDGETMADWVKFFEIERLALAEHPLYPTIGNHDEENGTAPNYVDLFELPTSSGAEEYYSFDYGNVHFTVLDGHVNVNFLGLFTLAQSTWIEQDLAAAQLNPAIDHIIVMNHMGPYSSKEGRSGMAQMRLMMATFQQYGVDLILSGHDHYYERGFSGNGIPYMISGGGGASLYTPDTDNSWLYPHRIDFRQEIHHWLMVEVKGPLMIFTAYDMANNILDTYEIGQPPACSPETTVADCGASPEGSCEGHYECLQYECMWICDPEAHCITAEDCTEDPPAQCENGDGAWECIAETCIYSCPNEGECSVDEDCAGKEALDDCPGGYYICEDAVCDWVCPAAPDGDEEPLDGDETVTPVDGDDAQADNCIPDARRCENNWVLKCDNSGTRWEAIEDCGDEGCEFGNCLGDPAKPDGDDTGPDGNLDGQPADGNSADPSAGSGSSGCSSTGDTSLFFGLFAALGLLVRRKVGMIA